MRKKLKKRFSNLIKRLFRKEKENWLLLEDYDFLEEIIDIYITCSKEEIKKAKKEKIEKEIKKWEEWYSILKKRYKKLTNKEKIKEFKKINEKIRKHLNYLINYLRKKIKWSLVFPNFFVY